MMFPIIALYIGLVAYGSANIQSGFFIETRCFGNRLERSFAITFDDGPNSHTTPLLLDLLKEHQADAGFFCVGKNIIGNEGLISRMHKDGHTIGNHTFSHSNFFDFYGNEKVVHELLKTEKLVEDIIQKKLIFFRPPYGVTNPAIRDASKALNYSTVGWDVRSLDTVIKSDQKVLERIKKKLRPGSIVLLHDTDPKVLDIVKGLIYYAKRSNYRIVAPHTLLNLDPYR